MTPVPNYPQEDCDIDSPTMLLPCGICFVFQDQTITFSSESQDLYKQSEELIETLDGRNCKEKAKIFLSRPRIREEGYYSPLLALLMVLTKKLNDDKRRTTLYAMLISSIHDQIEDSGASHLFRFAVFQILNGFFQEQFTKMNEYVMQSYCEAVTDLAENINHYRIKVTRLIIFHGMLLNFKAIQMMETDDYRCQLMEKIMHVQQDIVPVDEHNLQFACMLMSLTKYSSDGVYLLFRKIESFLSHDTRSKVLEFIFSLNGGDKDILFRPPTYKIPSSISANTAFKHATELTRSLEVVKDITTTADIFHANLYYTDRSSLLGLVRGILERVDRQPKKIQLIALLCFKMTEKDDNGAFVSMLEEWIFHFISLDCENARHLIYQIIYDPTLNDADCLRFFDSLRHLYRKILPRAVFVGFLIAYGVLSPELIEPMFFIIIGRRTALNEQEMDRIENLMQIACVFLTIVKSVRPDISGLLDLVKGSRMYFSDTTQTLINKMLDSKVMTMEQALEKLKFKE